MVVLARDAYRARRLLHQAAGIQAGEWVGIPANASHDLAESVKHHEALPRFLDFDAQLRLADVRYAPSPGRKCCAGCGSRRTLPGSTARTPCRLPGAAKRPAVTLHGLHLPDADDSCPARCWHSVTRRSMPR